MNFRSDSLFEMFENGELPAFYCDVNWKISSLNRVFEEKFPDVKVSQDVRGFSQNDTTFFSEAQEKLSKGLPYFSTNFELFFQNATIYIFPNSTSEISSPVYSACLCVLDLQPTQKPLLTITDSLRSPLNDILNSATFLATRAETNEDYQSLDYLNHIAKCCYSMLRTTTSTKTYYNLVNHKQTVKKEKLSLNSFFKELCQTLQILFLKSKYHFNYSICDEKIITMLDPELFSLTIFHLVSNACVASPQQANINVSLSFNENENSYCVTVSDEGNGIKSSMLNDIFKPFFTIYDSPVAEEGMHMGLGLPIISEILKLHDGVIFFNSRDGKGTSATIKLPIFSPPDEALTLQSNTTKYMTNKFSNSFIIFSDICDINLL